MELSQAGFLDLLSIFNPTDVMLKLGKHNRNMIEVNISQHSSSAKITPSIVDFRASVDMIHGKELLYPHMMASASYSKEIIGNMNCYVLRAKNAKTVPTLIMFYGGGFCLNTLFAHKSFMANVAAELECNIILPDYPLAPETKAPDSINRSTAFLRSFLNNSADFNFSDNIILLGWSSGSNMALTVAMNIENKAPTLFHKIKQLILLSPWIDLSLRVSREGPFQHQQKMDKLALDADQLEIMAKAYLPENCKGSEPEFCPVYRSPEVLKKLPAVTVISGACEVLFGDAVFLTSTLKNAGTPVEFFAVEGQTHNYMVFEELSRDGVFVPTLISHVVQRKAVENLIGKDGAGLIIKKFNMR